MLEALILGEDPWWELIFFHFLVNSRCLCFQFVESNRRLLSFSLPLQFFFFSGLPVELGVQIRQGLLRYFFRFLPCSASCLVGICRERQAVGAAQSPILDGFFERDMYLADRCFELWLR